MYLLTLILPFTSFFVIFFFGRFLGRHGSAVLAVSLLGVSFMLSLLAFYEVVVSRSTVFVELFSWLEGGVLSQSWNFLFDSATATMLVVVLSVSFLVHVYSLSYMSSDP